MINDLDIVPMTSGGPDLETLVRHGDAALTEVRRAGMRDGQNLWTVEVLNAQVHVEFEIGLTALAARMLAVTTLRSR
jgi:hypothetical protein